MIEVTVTEKDISRGVRYASLHCPIAQAVSRCTGQYAGVDLRFVTLYDEDGDIAGRWQTPPAAANWLAAFDRGETVRPASFQLTTPVSYPRIG